MIKMDAAARFLRYSPLAFVISLLTGCALIQDDPGEVPIVNPQQAQLAQVIHLANSGWPAARWWEGYHDPQLNMLVNRALQNSPTMQAARLRISQSQSTVELAQSAMGVQATAVAAQNRQNQQHASRTAQGHAVRGDERSFRRRHHRLGQ